ncbi:MAG: pyridoxal-phosphate-dependent aminotransferase family protein [Planctomycetota bacterium]|jgi:alanine-glyoxylate transaminase/serine-glyoxylate transaminase/serine-pyruvate transaminase
MKNLERILLGPGPSNTPPHVLEALARPTIGHLDPAFLEIMDGVRTKLRKLFITKNELTIPMSGTGSSGMETLFVNLLEPGDKVLVCVNGVFGNRMVDVAERCGAEVCRMDVPWGRVFEQKDIIENARKIKPKAVAIVHAETSTGAHQPVDELGAACHEISAMFFLDCVTSLGGAPVKIDEWGVDAAYSGTQKCLSCPPGLSPVTLSERAVEVLDNRKSKVQSWYLDLTMIRNYWGNERAYHHTGPINMVYGIDEALNIILEEGLENRWKRHIEMHNELKDGLAGLGLNYVSQKGHHLPMLNAVGVPEGVDDATVRGKLLSDFGIEIGGGLGDFKGKAWRIGIMGHNARPDIVDTVLNALKQFL